MTYYSFTAKGTLPDGTKMTASGHVSHERDDYPHEVFEKALACIEKLTPGFVMAGNTESRKNFPSLKRLKKAPKA